MHIVIKSQRFLRLMGFHPLGKAKMVVGMSLHSWIDTVRFRLGCLVRVRRYCVTVMDNWTPMREFFTLTGAMKFYGKHDTCAHLYRWDGEGWRYIRRGDRSC